MTRPCTGEGRGGVAGGGGAHRMRSRHIIAGGPACMRKFMGTLWGAGTQEGGRVRACVWMFSDVRHVYASAWHGERRL